MSLPGAVEGVAIGGPLLAAAAGAAYATFVPGSRIWGPVVTRGPSRLPARVALTFDDGPLPGATDRIIDVLGQLNVRAAFFVIGREAKQHPELVRRLHEQGHLIGNHTYDHWGWAFLGGSRFWRRQIGLTDDAVQRVIGLRPRFFRPPLGIKTWYTARAAAKHICVGWTRRAMDGIRTTSARIVERLAPTARAGEILALHDGISRQSRRDPAATIEALRPLVLGLRSRGLEPVRLDELLGVAPYRTATDQPSEFISAAADLDSLPPYVGGG